MAIIDANNMKLDAIISEGSFEIKRQKEYKKIMELTSIMMKQKSTKRMQTVTNGLDDMDSDSSINVLKQLLEENEDNSD
jgi:hypothetical protein